MRYRILGRTGLKISEVGFGGAPIGIPNYNEVWDPMSEKTSISVVNAMHKAIDLGYNYFDTAPSYGNGRSEELMGIGLNGKRDRIYLAGKTWWKGLDKKAVIESAETSLRRLKADYFDVLQFHGYNNHDYTPEDFTWIMENGPLEAYQQLKKDGKVRFLGITGEEPTTLRPFLGTGVFDVIQTRYNLIYQGAWHEVLPLAKELNVGVVIMRPLSSGIFQRMMRKARPDIDEYVDLNEIALNYVLSDPNVTTAIVGMRREEEVVGNNSISDNVDIRLDLDWMHERTVR